MYLPLYLEPPYTLHLFSFPVLTWLVFLVVRRLSTQWIHAHLNLGYTLYLIQYLLWVFLLPPLIVGFNSCDNYPNTGGEIKNTVEHLQRQSWGNDSETYPRSLLLITDFAIFFPPLFYICCQFNRFSSLKTK